jgi:AcrR family transcriptional regulator
MARSTRDRIVGEARDLFAARGYGATGTASILEAADINRGSLYHAFAGKEDLLAAVLEDYLASLRERVVDPAWAGTTDPVERVFALLDRYRRFLLDSDYLFACPIGSLALELRDPSPRVRELLARNFDQWAEVVRSCFEQVRDRLPAGIAPERLASLVLVTMEGGVMLSRTHRDLEDFDSSVALLRDYFERLGLAPGKKRAARRKA